jgi:hypothetical protein
VALEHLAYEEAKRAIDRQSSSLDGLRGRAGILLAAISLATSFFGGLALSDEDLSAGEVVVTVAAIIAFLGAAGACVAVLWPRQAEWTFNLSARKILGQLDATAPDEATVYRELALRHEADYEKNAARLDELFEVFRAACILLAAEVVAWIVVLAV